MLAGVVCRTASAERSKFSMRLDPFTRDYRSFMEELIEVIEAEGTLFYLDTSLLMWLLSLAPSARTEFIGWCKTRPVKAVRVPVWAAHELHWHLTAGSVLKNVDKTLSETEAKYVEFALLASERAEEAACLKKGFAGRASYVGQVEQILEAFVNLKRVISSDQAQLREAADDVIALVNECVLPSDLRPAIEELSRTGEFRYGHRIPPGFHDKKGENRYGDAIIWEEIIGDFVAAGPDSQGEPRHAVLLSRDRKTDWVSTAQFVTTTDGWAGKPNWDQELDVVLVHPLLAHEFTHRAGGKKIYVAPPGFFASALDFAGRKHGTHYTIDHWLKASHRPQLTNKLASLKLAAEFSASLPPTLSPAPSSPKDSTAREPLHAPPIQPQDFDITFEAEDVANVMSPPIAEELQFYLERSPLEQLALVDDWENRLLGGDWTSFKFGRVLAELAIRVKTSWTERLPAIIEQLSVKISCDSLNAVVLAIVSSVYFDRYGELLRRPHRDIGQIALLWETENRFKPAFTAIHRFLTDADANLPYLPGAGRKQVPYVLNLVQDSKTHAIQDIRIGRHSALAHGLDTENPRRLSVLLISSDECTGLELRALIAREYLIPIELLPSSYDGKKLTWPNDAGLVALDTESEGGLSALAEVESDND
jgi:hypothetical protein